jgi:hypothetical protein
LIALAAALLAAAPAPLSCGAVTRPGVAERGADGVWRGRAVALCHAVADAAGGPGAAILFHGYDSLAALRDAADDRIAFLSDAERAIAPLSGALRAGPPIAVSRQVLIVPPAAAARTPRDLAGRMICFIVGTRAEDALDAWARRAGVPIERLAFQEPVEMRDAYDVGKCAAIALDAEEANGDTGGRALDEPLASEPIMATTPVAAGDAWHGTVAGIVARAPAVAASGGGAG